jgi:uncharacterized protein (DUF1501 family)
MHGCRDYRSLGLTRRRALQVGALGGLGITLPGILRQEARADGTSPKAKSVILLWLQGGVSHHETFDPKPDAPDDVRGEFKTIATRLPGYRIGEHLPKVAALMDRLAVIRSVNHVESAHERGSMYMVEGRRPPLATGTTHSGNPEVASLVAHQLGMRNRLPAYVSIPGNDFTSRFTGPGWLPATAAAFRGTQAQSLKPSDKIDTDQFTDRLALRSAFGGPESGHPAPTEPEESWDRFTAQAVDILGSGKAAAAFRYQDEPEGTQKLYGVGPNRGDDIGALALTARRLVEAGVRFVTVGRNSWDYHENIFPQIRKRLPVLDDAFSGLVRDLGDRGLLDETLVLCMTEYGRTPKVNAKGGRDHWPNAFSIAVAGAGVRGGQVIGASDKHGATVKERPVSPEELAATILSLVGIDPRQQYVRGDGRPMMFVDEAAPIRELLA